MENRKGTGSKLEGRSKGEAEGDPKQGRGRKGERMEGNGRGN